MQNRFIAILCLAMCLAVLAGCKRPQEPQSEQPAAVPTTRPVAAPSGERFQFAGERFPRIDGSTATIPLIEAVTCALLGKQHYEKSKSFTFIVCAKCRSHGSRAFIGTL